jgi:hypothetical protein
VLSSCSIIIKNAYFRCQLSLLHNAMKHLQYYCSVRACTPTHFVLHASLTLHLNSHVRHNTLELAFYSKALRAICESETHAADIFGAAVTSALRHRLADLCAAKSPHDIPIGNPRVLGSDLTRMMVDLCDGFILTFCPNHPKNPQTESGLIDWQRVSRIKVLDIVHKNDQ